MVTLSDIVQRSKTEKRANGEVFYSLADFRRQLESLKEDSLAVQDCILAPYYIHAGALYELYEYELNIRLPNQPDFHRYLLKKTGRKAVEDIPDHIVRLQKECCIEVSKAEGQLPVERLLQYVDFLCAEEAMISQIQQVFGAYQRNDLWFAFYG